MAFDGIMMTMVRREMSDVPPCPKMLPNAISSVNTGAHSDTAATRLVSCVRAMK